MSHIDRTDLGYRHNQLREVAETLGKDGHTDLEADYNAQAAADEKAYDHLGRLGSKDVYIGKPHQIGADIADWLLANGWAAPDVLSCRVIETGDE